MPLAGTARALGWVLLQFYGAILWALSIAVLFLPVLRRLLRRLKQRRNVAARLVMLLVLVAVRLARIPWGALPSIPRWLGIGSRFGAFTAALGGRGPTGALGTSESGLGVHVNFTRVNLLAGVLLGRWT